MLVFGAKLPPCLSVLTGLAGEARDGSDFKASAAVHKPIKTFEILLMS
jgi:hypothetical protein